MQTILSTSILHVLAINFEDRKELINLDVGALILAVGFEQSDISKLKELGYGR
ncbi:unnamed protein product, partial [marine sediment metagenome]